MKILAVETATGNCSVAVLDSTSKKCIFRVCPHAPSQQAEHLFTLIDEVFSDGGLEYKNIDALAVSVGPGSFTGLRIGLAALQGVAMASNLPLIGVSSLEVICWKAMAGAGGSNNILVAMDARRGECYTQLFSTDSDAPKALSGPVLLRYEDVAAVKSDDSAIVAGDAAEHLRSYFPDGTKFVEMLPDADGVANLASALFIDGNIEGREVYPLYIRKPDAKKSAKM